MVGVLKKRLWHGMRMFRSGVGEGFMQRVDCDVERAMARTNMLSVML